MGFCAQGNSGRNKMYTPFDSKSLLIMEEFKCDVPSPFQTEDPTIRIGDDIRRRVPSIGRLRIIHLQTNSLVTREGKWTYPFHVR